MITANPGSCRLVRTCHSLSRWLLFEEFIPVEACRINEAGPDLATINPGHACSDRWCRRYTGDTSEHFFDQVDTLQRRLLHLTPPPGADRQTGPQVSQTGRRSPAGTFGCFHP